MAGGECFIAELELAIYTAAEPGLLCGEFFGRRYFKIAPHAVIEFSRGVDQLHGKDVGAFGKFEIEILR
jgi:hypothetical protein